MFTSSLQKMKNRVVIVAVAGCNIAGSCRVVKIHRGILQKNVSKYA
jgi:hypothetical protein